MASVVFEDKQYVEAEIEATAKVTLKRLIYKCM